MTETYSNITLQEGEEYWTYYLTNKGTQGKVCRATWQDDFVDNLRKESGRIFYCQSVASDALDRRLGKKHD